MPARSRPASSGSRPRCRGWVNSPSAARPSAPASNAPDDFDAQCGRAVLTEQTGLAELRVAVKPFRGAGRARRPGRGVRRAAHHRGVADQDRQRPPVDGLGPADRSRRDSAAGSAAGQLDHAGQGQSGYPEAVTQVAAQVIGNDAAIAWGGAAGAFELNVYIPMMARNLLESFKILTNVVQAVRRNAASTAWSPTRRGCASSRSRRRRS